MGEGRGGWGSAAFYRFLGSASGSRHRFYCGSPSTGMHLGSGRVPARDLILTFPVEKIVCSGIWKRLAWERSGSGVRRARGRRVGGSPIRGPRAVRGVAFSGRKTACIKILDVNPWTIGDPARRGVRSVAPLVGSDRRGNRPHIPHASVGLRRGSGVPSLSPAGVDPPQFCARGGGVCWIIVSPLCGCRECYLAEMF